MEKSLNILHFHVDKRSCKVAYSAAAQAGDLNRQKERRMNIRKLWLFVFITQILCSSVEGRLSKRSLSYLFSFLFVCFSKGEKKNCLLTVHFRE